MRPGFGRQSILRFSLVTSTLLAVAVGVVTVVAFLITVRQVYRRELDRHAAMIGQFAAAEAQFPLLVEDWGSLQRLAEKTAAIDDVLYVEIVDRNCQGIRLAKPGFAVEDIPPCVLSDPANLVRRSLSSGNSRSFIEVSSSVDAPDSSMLIDVYEPQTVQPSIGRVRTGLSVDRAKSNAAVALRRAVLVWAVCLIFILFGVFLRLRRLVAPVLELAAFASGINEESLDKRVHIAGLAELDAVAEAFNRMLDRLAATLVSRDLAEQSSKAKGQFLANMGHELRTPLNAIIGYSEMIAEECVDRDLDDLLPDLLKIRNAGRMLLDLMNDLLDYSKAEAGRIQLTTQLIDVSLALREVADTVEPMARHNGNRLRVEPLAHALEICGDPLRFRQSLLNLASNACKFTENGVVTLSAAPALRGGRLWCDVSVADTGIGIPAGRMHQLFEAFVQMEPSSTRKYSGTGLGLAISRKFCRMMGGDITVESAAGQGSTFTISLPAGCAPQTSSDFAETIRGT